MNQITPISTADFSAALRDTAMLADVTIGTWSAERTDHKIMDDIKAQAGATGNVGRAIKNMLAGADGKLRDARAAYAAVRSQHYALTLPWVSDPHAERMRGPRLLPTELFDRYLVALSQKKRVALQALDAFIADYPDAIQRARANLAGLADATYPTEDEVRACFKVSFDFEPLPSGADFRGLPDQTLAKLAGGLKKKQDTMIAGAQAAVFEQVRERVAFMAARLADKDAKFKAGTVENVRELSTLLPAWNIAGDARIDELAADIDRMISGVDAAKLRDDDAARADVAAQAQSVVDKLSGWGL